MASHLRISRLRPRRFLRHPLASPRGMIALVLVLAATAVGVLGFRQRASPTRPPGPTARVLTAAHDVAAGTALTRADVRSSTLPADDVPDGVLRDPDQALGRRVASPVRRGEPLTDARLIGTGLAVGLPESGAVAMPLRLADAGIAALLRPGDRIDVLASPDPAELGTDAGPFGIGPVPAEPGALGSGPLGATVPKSGTLRASPLDSSGPDPGTFGISAPDSGASRANTLGADPDGARRPETGGGVDQPKVDQTPVDQPAVDELGDDRPAADRLGADGMWAGRLVDRLGASPNRCDRSAIDPASGDPASGDPASDDPASDDPAPGSRASDDHRAADPLAAGAGAAGSPASAGWSAPRDQGAGGHDLAQGGVLAARPDSPSGSLTPAAVPVVSDVTVLAVPTGSDSDAGDALIVVAVPAADAPKVAGAAALLPLTVVIRPP